MNRRWDDPIHHAERVVQTLFLFALAVAAIALVLHP